MKSNEKYRPMFFYLLPVSVPCCRSSKFYLNMPGDLDHVIILTSFTQLNGIGLQQGRTEPLLRHCETKKIKSYLV